LTRGVGITGTRTLGSWQLTQQFGVTIEWIAEHHQVDREARQIKIPIFLQIDFFLYILCHNPKMKYFFLIFVLFRPLFPRL